jgi:hypothetical protein
MKKVSLVLLALALFAGSAPPPIAAQAAAAPDAAVPDKCPCADYRFVAKTEKAKAVAAFWEARREYKIASGLGSMALMFTMFSRRPTAELNGAQREMGEAGDELLKARNRAVELHGLTVQGDGPEAPVLVKLQNGVDYELK